MNKEEAIKQLKMDRDLPIKEDDKKALDMAAKALEQEKYYKDLAQSYEKTIVKLTEAIAERQPCEDCVSRKEVMDMTGLYADWFESSDSYNDFVAELYKLPSITPKGVTVTDFADRCRECGARYGKQLKKLERIKERYNEERGILLNSSLEYTANNILDIIDYIIHGD